MKPDRSLRLAQGLLVCCLMVSSSAQAQLVPDGTLGGERSRVTPIDGKTDRIDGGALRGVNLFHSFLEFNVGDGKGAYFANPAAVQNIFSRVTGINLSKIDGTLGVLGKANLFLLNPNGIIFGPNARLDVAGSFFASTASEFKFANGSEFSATNPQAAPLLMVDLTPGLQRGGTLGAIANAGNLSVGRDLTLSGGTVTSTGQLAAPQGQLSVEAVVGDARVRDVTAQSATLYANNNLILEESQLYTTGDLNLLAQNTVRVRDSVANPFLAQAGGNLYIRGNQGIDILALNHPQTPFISGGNLSLVSDGNISGDAHFASGRSFSVLKLSGQLGSFLSSYDPIISVNGDVIFNGYQGTALKVEATGSITVTGDINIIERDSNLTGPPGSDRDILASSPALILRAGTNLEELSFNSNSGPPNPNFPYLEPISGTTFSPNSSTGGSINVQNINTRTGPTTSTVPFAQIGNGGTVILSAEGNISVNAIDASSTIANAAPVSLTSKTGNIQVRGGLNASSTTGNGGVVTLVADKGNVEIKGNILSGSEAGKTLGNTVAFNAGNIYVFAGGNITVDFSSNPGGFIKSNIEGIYNNGNGGQTLFEAPNGEIIIARATMYNTSGQATNFNVDPENGTFLAIDVDGGEGKSGDIKIQGKNITLIDTRLDVGASKRGNLGTIQLEASDKMRLFGSQILTVSYRENSLGVSIPESSIKITGKSISLNGRRSQINDIPGFFLSPVNDDKLDPYFPRKTILDSRTFRSVTSGNIFLRSVENITINDGSLVATSVLPTGSAPGGNINITSQNGSISLADLASITASTSGIGRGGDVTVQSLGSSSTVSISNGSRVESRTFGVGDRKNSGDVVSGGDAGDVVINAPNVIISGSTKFYNQDFFSGVLTSSDTAKSGQGGSIIINKDVSPIGRTLLVEKGGFLSALNRSYIKDGKDIEVNVDELKLINGGQIITATEGIMKAGGIIINSPRVTISGINPSLQNIRDKNSFLFQTPEGQTFDSQYFSTGFDSNIDFSTTIPHATFYRSGRGEYDFYKFTVTTGNRAIFNIDNDLKGNQNDTSRPIDTQLFLFNSSGQLLATNDDSLKDNGSREDLGQLDSYLDYTFRNPGNYILGVGKYPTQVNPQGSAIDNTLLTGGNSLIPSTGINPPKIGERYTLQVSINSQNTLNPNRIDVSGTSRSGLFAGGDATGGGAGQLIINGRGSGLVTIEKGGQILASTVSGTGNDVSLQGLSTLNINDGSIIASTIDGKAGNLTLNKDSVPARSVTLTNSTISLAANGSGSAGSIALNTQQLSLENGSEITASTESGIGGGVTLEGLSTLKVNDSLISAITNAKSGSAGNLTISAPGGVVDLNGTRPNGTPGGLSVQADDGGTAGKLDVVTQEINIQNGSQVSVSSPSGLAGNLNITANYVTLNAGRLIANSGANNPDDPNQSTGSINLQGPQILSLKKDSRIRILSLKNESKIVATAGKLATGGNINIAADFVFGFPPTGLEGSDISANADLGKGGIVKIERTAIFGLTYRPKLTPLNDITATSNAGLQGTVTFTGIDVDPTRGLSPLPIETRDPSNLIDQSCSPGGAEKQTSQYTNTGRGGLPPSPDDPLNTDTSLAQLATPVLQSANRSSQATSSLPDNKSPDAIVEAQGWMKLPNGRIRLVTQATTVTPHGNWQPPFGCSTPQGTKN